MNNSQLSNQDLANKILGILYKSNINDWQRNYARELVNEWLWRSTPKNKTCNTCAKKMMNKRYCNKYHTSLLLMPRNYGCSEWEELG